MLLCSSTPLLSSYEGLVAVRENIYEALLVNALVAEDEINIADGWRQKKKFCEAADKLEGEGRDGTENKTQHKYICLGKRQ
jgi:hypothetical protein